MKKKSVICSAEHSLAEAIRQEKLGYEYALIEMNYWSAFLDGAIAQKAEDEFSIETCEMQKAEIIALTGELGEANAALSAWPPVQPGSTIYHVCAAFCGRNKILKHLRHEVEAVRFNPAEMWNFDTKRFYSHYYLTKEEADEALKNLLGSSLLEEQND